MANSTTHQQQQLRGQAFKRAAAHQMSEKQERLKLHDSLKISISLNSFSNTTSHHFSGCRAELFITKSFLTQPIPLNHFIFLSVAFAPRVHFASVVSLFLFHLFHFIVSYSTLSSHSALFLSINIISIDAKPLFKHFY